MNLEVTLAGKKFKNPVTTASGTFGYGAEYEQFVDLAAVLGDEVVYTPDGEVEAKIAFEAAKDKKAEDLVIMLVNPETSEIVFITLGEDDLDPKTGEIKVKLPFLGAITILDKSAEAAE